tara:strand:+ start:476 stop:1330 length:855 start_codon:yes stop_codon:yes gene_type:complete
MADSSDPLFGKAGKPLSAAKGGSDRTKKSNPYQNVTRSNSPKSKKGQAPVPTDKQKQSAASLAASAIGGAFGKPIMKAAISIGKPQVEKLLKNIKGGSTKTNSQQAKDILLKAKDRFLKEDTAHKASSMNLNKPRGTGKEFRGTSNRDVKIGNTVGKAGRVATKVGLALSGVPAAKAKDTDTKLTASQIQEIKGLTKKKSPKTAPRPRPKPKVKAKVKKEVKPKVDNKEYSTTRRGQSGRNVQTSSNKKNANVVVDMGAVPKKKAGGRIGVGSAMRGFGAVRNR